MNFYKKAILTLSGAGMLMGCAHKELEAPVSGQIIDMTSENSTTKCYLDIDGDGLVDREMEVPNNDFNEYATVGDTVRYKTMDRNAIHLFVAPRFANCFVVDINGRTLDELEKRRQINKLRERLGQEKQR